MKNVTPRCTRKVDITKAFDSVKWKFLLKLLAAINVPPEFLKWVAHRITTPRFSNNMNGELAGYFERQ